jgi:hypothetical protein
VAVSPRCHRLDVLEGDASAVWILALATVAAVAESTLEQVWAEDYCGRLVRHVDEFVGNICTR